MSVVFPIWFLSPFRSFPVLTSSLVSPGSLPATTFKYTFTKAPKKVKSFVVAFSQFRLAFTTALNFALGRRHVQVHLALWFLRRHYCGFGPLFCLTFFKPCGAEVALNTIGTGDRDRLTGCAQARGRSCVNEASASIIPHNVLFLSSIFCMF